MSERTGLALPAVRSPTVGRRRVAVTDGLDDLLVAAFTRLATTISDTFEPRLGAARDQREAVEAIVSLIHGDLQRSRREQVLTYELYTLDARRAEFRTITQSWMQASRHALERHFAPGTARALDAYIEGAALHIALDPDPQSAAQTREAITRLIGPSDDQGGPREEDR